ncbi:hypothetical protein Tco_0313591 [Tanacetum coccineum]
MLGSWRTPGFPIFRAVIRSAFLGPLWTWVLLDINQTADDPTKESSGGSFRKSSSAAAPEVSAPEVSALAEVEPEMNDKFPVRAMSFQADIQALFVRRAALFDPRCPGFFSTLQSMDYEQLYTEFNVGGGRVEFVLQSVILNIKLKSLLVEEAEKAERAETAEVVRLRDQVSALTGEVSVLKSTIAQKDTDISLLDSRATYLNSAL